ncbi:hypothetical protein I4U23_022456 [Adineta vaga]|nr:hypothetical protein I4U23_022456 [Adineta vaga]
MQFMWIFILILTTIPISSSTFILPSIKSVNIYNDSAVNIIWKFNPLEEYPFVVNLTVVIFKLNTTDVYRSKNFIMNDKDLMHFSSFIVVDNHFLKANAYYAGGIEYKVSSNGNTSSGFGFSAYILELFKMAKTPIPREKTSTKVTSNSAIVSMYWPKEIPLFELEMNAQLNGWNTTSPVETITNDIYLIKNFRFGNLLPGTRYRVETKCTRKYVSNIVSSESQSSVDIIRTSFFK